VLNRGTSDGRTDGAHGSGGSQRRDAGEAAQGGEVEGVASLAWGGGERERAAHGGHGSTTGGHGCNSEREGESSASECQREPEGARALGFHYRRAHGRDRGRPRGNGALQWRERAHAWSPCTGHAASVGAFPRTPGERRSEHGGAQVWASYGPIWSMGPKQSLLTSVCSTFLIKGAKSFEQ